MSNDLAIPTLGKEGTITDPNGALNYLMLCFFFSKYSQSAICRGSVISLTKVLQSNGSDPSQVIEAIENGLTELLERHFDTASVTCNQISEPDESDMDISLDVTVTTGTEGDAKRINLGYALTIGDSKFKKILSSLTGEVLFNE